MGRYNQYDHGSRMQARPWKVHPVWRGIGCFMLILIPVMSYAGAEMLVKANLEAGWYRLPREMTRAVALPALGEVPNLFGNLLVGAILALIGFCLLMVLYSMVYKVAGPPELGPLDAPPMHLNRQQRRQRGDLHH